VGRKNRRARASCDEWRGNRSTGVGLQAQSDREWRELLAEQVRQHARLWFRLAYDILHDAHAAEDVCQQALLRAWSNRERLRDAGQLRACISRSP